MNDFSSASEMVAYYTKLQSKIREKCYHCICKTCHIAEINGGAPGCGDCFKCQENDFALFCNRCHDYYNTHNAYGDTLEYRLRKEKERKEDEDS